MSSNSIQIQLFVGRWHSSAVYYSASVERDDSLCMVFDQTNWYAYAYRTVSRLFVFGLCPFRVCVLSGSFAPIFRLLYSHTKHWYIYCCDSSASALHNVAHGGKEQAFHFYQSSFNSNWFFVWRVSFDWLFRFCIGHCSSTADRFILGKNREKESLGGGECTAWPAKKMKPFLFAFMANTCLG